MNAQIEKKFSISAMLIKVAIVILIIIIIIIIPKDRATKRQVDISIMGDEKPVKIISLDPYISTGENPENAYILGDKGNLYVLCCDSKNYYVELWHPEFWEGIKVVDLCVEEKKSSYALALDQEENVYIWDKEYRSQGLEWEKKEDWNVQRMENIPEVLNIYAGYNQFALVTKENEIYSWNPIDNVNPRIDNMEGNKVENQILNIVPLEEELLILDRNNVLWSIENGTRNVLKENVKSIVQGGKGFVIQMMDDENEVYVYNIPLLQKGYETVTFADKYEVSKVSFEREISSLSVSDKSAVVCIGKEKFYKWGKKEDGYKSVVVTEYMVYDKPVKADLKGAKYYMLIGKDTVYVDKQNRMFVLIPY